MQTPTRPNRLREMRERAGLVQEDVAGLVGVRATTISRLERGVMTPSFGLAQALARELSAKVGEPLGVDDLFPQPEAVA